MTDADVAPAVDASAIPADATDSAEEPLVTAHRSAPGRTVLTEHGNTEAWIASSLTLGLSR